MLGPCRASRNWLTALLSAAEHAHSSYGRVRLTCALREYAGASYPIAQSTSPCVPNLRFGVLAFGEQPYSPVGRVRVVRSGNFGANAGGLADRANSIT